MRTVQAIQAFYNFGSFHFRFATCREHSNRTASGRVFPGDDNI
jgi:hypothetical protein